MRAYKQQITNSSTYNNSLKQRGRLDFWIDKDIFLNWNYKGKQTKGGKLIYSDVAIEIALILSYVYSLSLRQTEGFLSSFLQLHHYQLTVPDYTTLCRRKRKLDVRNKLKKWNGKENIVFAIDGSGLKCSGEKEWTQTQYRRARRRKFIKIHAGININTRHVLFNKSTHSKVSDISVLSEAIESVDVKFDALFADGGYDSKSSYQLTKPSTKVVIPPRRNAVTDKQTHQRNEAIEYIKEHRKSRWKREYGYHQRALVENLFSRWKTIYGENIRSKNSQAQQTEVTLKSFILNKMTDLGMPEWKRIYFLN
jgi:hypothetical protein